MKAKVSIADWVKIAGVIGSGILTLIGFIVWLTHVDTRVSAVADAQAETRVQLAADHDSREKRDAEVLDQLRDMNTRLSRIEGIQTAVLKEVRNASQ